MVRDNREVFEVNRSCRKTERDLLHPPTIMPSKQENRMRQLIYLYEQGHSSVTSAATTER